MPAGTLVFVSQSQEIRAIDLIGSRPDKMYSITDACSFIVMEDLRLTHAFTFDHHFRQHGYLMVPHLEH